MSQKIRVGNTYYHTDEEQLVVTTNRDHENNVWYRGVESRDNGGVISTTDWLKQQQYDEFLGAVRMRDYPDDDEWQRKRNAVHERDDYQCQCGKTVNNSAPVHHIVPLGCGGSNALSNLITVCEECHGKVHGGAT